MAAENELLFKRGQGRIWLQRYGSGPSHPVEYLGCGRLSGLDKDEGDLTPIYVPSSSVYGEFVAVDTIKGEPGLPTSTVEARLKLSNPLLEYRCPLDIQAHFGTPCEDPLDYIGGWKLILMFHRARITSRGTSDLVAVEPGDEEPIFTTADFSALDWMQIKQMVFEEVAQNTVLQEAVAIVCCDRPQCGECGDESDGCQVFYGVAKGSGPGSPGWPAELFWTTDGGSTWQDQDITTLASDEVPSDLACVGNLIVVISADSVSLHYAYKTDLATWAEVATGFVTAPNAIWSVMPTKTWIVGDSGYVYFTDDPTGGVAVQNCSATNENLNDVMFLNSREGLAVGDNNAVIHTENGGSTWESITGPDAGANLLCCWMRTSYEWLVGTDQGQLWYTTDKGETWNEKSFPGSTLGGQVKDIAFSRWEDGPVGYLAWYPDGVSVANGRILRTTNGGYSWYILPEGRSTIPANHGINALAVCDDPNVVLAVGLATDDSDGFAVRGRA